MAVALNEDCSLMCCTLSGVTAIEAEDMSIAFEARQPRVEVVSNSKTAIKKWESARVTASAAIIEKARGPKERLLLVWASAHQGRLRSRTPVSHWGPSAI